MKKNNAFTLAESTTHQVDNQMKAENKEEETKPKDNYLLITGFLDALLSEWERLG